MRSFYWGDALQVLDYGDFPKRRPEAADIYLKALAEVLQFKPLPVKKELLPQNEVFSGEGGDPDDPDGRKAFNATMANWEAQRLNDSMQRNHKVVVGQLVALYHRQPAAAAELEARAKAAIADPRAVRELLDELGKARAGKNPAGGAKGNLYAHVSRARTDAYRRHPRHRFRTQACGLKPVASSLWPASDQALVPPSTVRLAPLMNDASGPATKATSAATSSTVP